MPLETNNFLKKGIISLLLKGIFPEVRLIMANLAVKLRIIERISDAFVRLFGCMDIFKPGLVWVLSSIWICKYFLLSSLIPGNGEER